MSPFERGDAVHRASSASVATASAAGARRYRPDLDGLRGYAVVIAILFHYGLGVPGGFVGLDIFFVLSGYLIGGILFGDVGGGRFSFARFYEYRVRRIAPAALTMILVCFALAYLILLPLYYRYFAKSALANLYFGTNHLFWGEDGYFAPASENKPLLHTWSLAVEEQFYFVFPLLVLGLYRWGGRRAWRPAIAWLALVSFACNLVMTVRDPNGAYFLAPARAWEILLGALVALQPQRVLSRRGRNAMTALGVAMILVATFAFDSSIAYPGWPGLLPCLGSALVIYAGAAEDPAVNRWIGHPVPRFLGVISYSLYLWHWPVLVFARFLMVEPPTAMQKLVLLALVFLIGLLSWKYVEQPFRAGRRMPARRVVGAAAAGAALVLACGLGVRFSDGAPARPQFDPAVVLASESTFKIDACFINGRSHKQRLQLDACAFGTPGVTPSVLLWGDSHARQWQPGLIEAARRHGAAFVQAATSTCPPVLGFALARRPACSGSNERVYAWLREHPAIETVILAGRWGSYDDEAALPAHMAETTRTLRALGKRVVVVGAVPTYTRPVPIMLTAWLWRHGDVPSVRVPADSPDSYFEKDRRAFRVVFADAPVDAVLDAGARLCDARGCAIRAERQPLYVDQTHLSAYAARRCAELFEPVFRARPAMTTATPPSVAARPAA